MYTGTLDHASTQADWIQAFEVLDADSGADISLTGATIVFALREKSDNQQSNAPAWPSATLTATTANGKVTIPSTGVFQVWFPLSDMQSLCAGYYDVGCTITLNGVTTQFIVGTLPVLDGIATQ